MFGGCAASSLEQPSVLLGWTAGPRQTVPRAELLAVVCLLEQMRGEVMTMFCGRGLRLRGKQVCQVCGWCRPEVGEQCVLKSTCAHSDSQRILAGRIALRDLCGNIFTDRAAGEAAANRQPPDQVSVYRKCHAEGSNTFGVVQLQRTERCQRRTRATLARTVNCRR